MDELYTIDVDRLAISLVLRRGERLEGQFFLRSVGERHRGPETLGDRLNDPLTHFLPCEIEGRVELIRLSGLAYLEHEGRLPEVDAEAALGAQRAPVELILDSGEALRGELLYILPPERHRVLDHLNSPELRFLLLRQENRTLYVHREAVLRARS